MAKKKVETPPAPPPPRRRRGLAGRFDACVAWALRVAKGKDLTTKDKVIVSTLVVAVASYFVRGALAGRSSAPVLNAKDQDTLKTVFFSGDPWMIECTAKGKPSPAVFEAEKLMAQTPSEVKLGLLDCGATLPSGKTTLERFKLTPPADGPMVLLFANMESRPAMATGSLVSSGASLLRWARETSKPKVQKPTSTETLDKHCLKKKWCVLVFTAVSTPSDGERASLSKLAKGLRDVKFVTVDSAKYTMKLELPDPNASPDAESPEPINLMPTKSRSAVLLLKPAATGEGDEKKTAAMALAIPSDPTAKQALDDGLKDAPAAITTIRGLITAAEKEAAEVPSGFTLLDEPVTLRTRRSHRRRANNPSKSRGDTSRTLTDEELKELRENQARAKREREEKRKQQMQEEAAAADNLVEEVDEGAEGAESAEGMYEDGEDGEEEVEEEEVEEEEMELDD